MHIIIAGAGVVGTSLAEQLSRENHDIVLIEADRNRAATISDSLDILRIQGSASSPGILHRAGIRSADVLIAVTESDEVNLVVCAIGKSMGCLNALRGFAIVNLPTPSTDLTSIISAQCIPSTQNPLS